MPPRRYNDFHQLHTTISKAGELGAEALAAAAFPEKQWFKSMLSTKDLAVRPNHSSKGPFLHTETALCRCFGRQAERTKQLTGYIEHCKQAIVEEQVCRQQIPPVSSLALAIMSVQLTVCALRQPQPAAAGGGECRRHRLLASAAALVAFLQLREGSAGQQTADGERGGEGERPAESETQREGQTEGGAEGAGERESPFG